MPFKLSRYLCLQLPDISQALEFYNKVMGLEIVYQGPTSIELHGGQTRLFLDKGEHLGPVFEFLVPDLEKAREELLEKGCEVVRWEGKGNCCYMRDPFGFVFNLFEEPESFED